MTRKCRSMSMMLQASSAHRFSTPPGAPRPTRSRKKSSRVWVIRFLLRNWTKWIIQYTAREKPHLEIWIIKMNMWQNSKIRPHSTTTRRSRAPCKDHSSWVKGIIFLEVLLQEHSRLLCKMCIRSIGGLWGRVPCQARPSITPEELQSPWIHTTT